MFKIKVGIGVIFIIPTFYIKNTIPLSYEKDPHFISNSKTRHRFRSLGFPTSGGVFFTQSARFAKTFKYSGNDGRHPGSNRFWSCFLHVLCAFHQCTLCTFCRIWIYDKNFCTIHHLPYIIRSLPRSSS